MGAPCGAESTTGRALLGAVSQGCWWPWRKGLPVLDHVLCHGIVTNSIRSQPGCEETGLRLHSGSARQREEEDQSFRDSSEVFAKMERPRSSREDKIAVLTVEAGHWTSRGRQTDRAGPETGSPAWEAWAGVAACPRCGVSAGFCSNHPSRPVPSPHKPPLTGTLKRVYIWAPWTPGA